MSAYDGRVVSTFIRQALTGQPFGIFGDGTQQRSFCYVSDLIEGIISAALSTSNGPINLGNPQEITLNQLAKEIADALEVDLTFDYLQLPVDDPIRRCPDISLARQVLKWEPRVNIQEGILKTATWMKEQLP
jgi:dTDP-glucose 4,6-dehydratase